MKNHHVPCRGRRMKRQYSMRTRFFVKQFLQNVFLLLVPILIIGPYSIFLINRESRDALERSSYNILYQTDETMNSLMGELDNVYYYIRSNPSVITGLRTAYNEPELTLNSLRNINSICSLLRYYMYTSSYIDTIYVYYYNSNNRILVPEQGMISREAYRDTGWLDEARYAQADVWLDAGMVLKEDYSNPEPMLYYFRKLYSTIDPSNPIGVIAAEYNADAFISYMNSLNLYSGQTIAVVNRENQILVQNDERDLSELLEEEKKKELGKFDYYETVINGEKYTVSRMQSWHVGDLEYVSVVPTRNLIHSSGQFAGIFLLLICGAIVVSVVLAAVHARKDYKNLEDILNLLSSPDQMKHKKPDRSEAGVDPYHYITYNIIDLFIQQDYLKIQTSEQKYKLQALELAALQQQINPHFLHNTLNTIYWEAVSLTKGPNTCSEMLTKLASIMRYSLGNPEETVMIREELEYLKSYVYIQIKRYNHKFSVEYDVAGEALNYPIRKMLLQPLVENAISHGIKSVEREGVIRLKIHCRTEYVYVSVTDNGRGIEKTELKKLRELMENQEEYTAHVGLLNVHRRLVLVYGKESGIHILSKTGRGTCVYFRLSASKEEQLSLSKKMIDLKK